MHPTYGPVGLFADSTDCVTPFLHWIEDYPLSDGLKMPSHEGSYDGKGDPDNYLHLFEGAIRMQKWAMPVAYHMFTYTLKDSIQIWWNDKKQIRSLVEFLSTDLPTTYKGLMEKTYTWIEAKEVNTNGAPSDHIEGFNKFNKDHGHETNQCRELRRQMEEAVKSGKLAHLVKGIKKGKAKTSDTQLGEWKKGDKDIVLAETPILMVNKESHTSKKKYTKEFGSNIWKAMDSKILLLRFSREHSWPPREVPLEVTVAKSSIAMQKMRIVVSTVHAAIKFHTLCGIGIVFSTYEPNKVEKGQKKVKETITKVTKDVLSCVDAKERIIVNDKHLE
ncbi:hypothetical protein Tco_1568349 [Tanacetum coccineum]